MTASALLNFLNERDVSIRVDGDCLVCRVTRGKVGQDILALVREHKRELVEFLRESESEWRSERLRLPDEPCDIVEPWDRSGLENLLAVARQAGFQFEVDHRELAVRGPTAPCELWRLIREQATGFSLLLRDGC